MVLNIDTFVSANERSVKWEHDKKNFYKHIYSFTQKYNTTYKNVLVEEKIVIKEFEFFIAHYFQLSPYYISREILKVPIFFQLAHFIAVMSCEAPRAMNTARLNNRFIKQTWKR